MNSTEVEAAARALLAAVTQDMPESFDGIVTQGAIVAHVDARRFLWWHRVRIRIEHAGQSADLP